MKERHTQAEHVECMPDDAKCGELHAGGGGLNYVRLLGEYVKLSLERDGLRRAVDRQERGKHAEAGLQNKLLVMLGNELRGDGRYYLTWHERGEQHDAVSRDLRAVVAGKLLPPAKLPVFAPELVGRTDGAAGLE